VSLQLVAKVLVAQMVMGYGIVLAKLISIFVLKITQVNILVLLFRIELSYHLIRIVGKIETALVLLINIIIKNYQKF
jgi:hypothetical protein